jgi:hypothetical protein
MANLMIVDQVHSKSFLSFIPNGDAHLRIPIGVLEGMLVLLAEIFHSCLQVRVVAPLVGCGFWTCCFPA